MTAAMHDHPTTVHDFLQCWFELEMYDAQLRSQPLPMLDSGESGS